MSFDPLDAKAAVSGAHEACGYAKAAQMCAQMCAEGVKPPPPPPPREDFPERDWSLVWAFFCGVICLSVTVAWKCETWGRMFVCAALALLAWLGLLRACRKDVDAMERWAARERLRLRREWNRQRLREGN